MNASSTGIAGILPRVRRQKTDSTTEESWATSAATRRSMQGNRSKDTRPEIQARSALHRAGFRFRKNVRPIPSVRLEADIVFPRQRLVVLIDGCFWHGCAEHGRPPKSTTRNADYWEAKIRRNLERDRENEMDLSSAGWTVLRFWEHEPADAIVGRVAATLKKTSGLRQLA